MTHPRVPRVLSIVALVAGLASQTWAASVGGNFQGRGGDAAPVPGLAPSETAGVLPQSHWNSIDSNPNFTGTTAPLVDDSGNFTAVRIIYDCSDSWNSD